MTKTMSLEDLTKHAQELADAATSMHPSIAVTSKENVLAFLAVAELNCIA